MATELVEEGVEPLIDALRSVGGTASAASLTTTVACPIVPTDDPIALPRAHARDQPKALESLAIFPLHAPRKRPYDLPVAVLACVPLFVLGR